MTWPEAISNVGEAAAFAIVGYAFIRYVLPNWF